MTITTIGSSGVAIEGDGNNTIVDGTVTQDPMSAFIFALSPVDGVVGLESIGEGTVYVQVGNGTNCVITGYGNDIVRVGSGDNFIFAFGSDYIIAPSDGSSIHDESGTNTYVLGGHHEQIHEMAHPQFPPGIGPGVDRIFGFNHTDRLVIEDAGKHHTWHQNASGMLTVNYVAIADVIGHHLTHHDLLFT